MEESIYLRGLDCLPDWEANLSTLRTYSATPSEYLYIDHILNLVHYTLPISWRPSPTKSSLLKSAPINSL